MDKTPEQPKETAEIAERPKGLLYHYTDQAGFLGIIESKTIRATHVKYLNDASEFLMGWDKAWDALFLKIHKEDIPEKDANYKKSLEKVYQNFQQEIMRDEQRAAYYVSCFTDDKAADDKCIIGFEGDRLSQWRGYSKGESGFSLGFDADELQKSITASGDLIFKFDRCEYNVKKQEEHSNALAEKHLPAFIQAWDIYYKQLRDPALTPSENHRKHSEHLFQPMMEMFIEFIKYGMFIKHQGFREENEWRYAFIARDSSLISF
jgi:hypothetical protein